MSRTEDRSLEHRLDDLEGLAGRLEIVHVQTVLVLVRRAEPWAGQLRTAEDVAAFAEVDPVDPETGAYQTLEVLERRPDLDLLLDPRTGTRRLRSRVEDVETFDRIAAQVELVQIEITVHERQLEALESEASIVAALGGNRTGKTRIGLYWLIRQWILRGHGPRRDEPAALLWLLAPTQKKAWERLTKDLAPLIPARLRVGSLPKSERATLQIVLLDGSVIEALHTHGDGDNLKSSNVTAILFDEASASRDEGNWQQCNSRIAQKGARCFLPTTPKPGHWAYTAIVLQEPHAGGRIRTFHFDLFDNPWLTTPRIWALLLGDGTITQTELEEQILCAEDPAAACRALVESARALREHFGIWTADGVRLWSEWTEEIARACTRAGQGVYLAELVHDGQTLVPVTSQAALGFSAWSDLDHEQTRVLGGQDFNVNPQTTVLAQVFGIPSDPGSWVLYVSDEIQTQGTVELHGERLAQTWPGLPLAVDPNGDIPRVIQQAGEGDEAARLRELGFPAHSCVGRGQRLRSQKPTLNLLHFLMRRRRLVVHLRCRELLKALQIQQARPDGRIDKRSGTRSPSDRASAPTDALRYLTWALFRHEIEIAVQWD